MNYKKRFLQFILHFPACIAPVPFLQEHPHLRQNPVVFAGFPPHSSNRIRTAASRPAFFRFLPSFLKPSHAKTGEGPSKAPAGLFNCRQKFVKFRYKSKAYTTISYSPMPPDEKYRCKSKGENTPRSVTMPEMRCGGVRSNAG